MKLCCVPMLYCMYVVLVYVVPCDMLYCVYVCCVYVVLCVC